MKILKFTFLFVVITFCTLTLFSQQNKNNKNTDKIVDSIKVEIKGEIISKSGTSVTVKLSKNKELLVKGKVGILSKYFEEKIFGINTTGWLDIGKVKLSAIKADVYVFQIIEEHSIIIKNDKKVDNFKVGAIVKFE